MTTTSLTFDVKTDDYLIWQGQVVMSRSEHPYFCQLFECLAKDLRPTRVLEIGFGLGISADLIQHYLHPAEHHIVEVDTGIYADLVQFASAQTGVVPYLGDWRSTSLPAPFDLVFYDPFDYSSEPDDVVSEASLLRRLVGNEGALCHPHFGDGLPRSLPGFQTAILERFLVPEIEMADGTHCGHAAAVLCFSEK
ncbi:class I SAM-dependent methyltransferase [Variovorax paradoxus]|uniref:class I SAM-dependent methyltransferase n=1 Tax=Variovorax paradoxus TaxID=34073 RepID=UPI0021ACCD06|nr:class I SAM-dependent methyltransferase [Variovorax paradoxus]UVH55166.1 class I SAM-dependent methyltransferase [Variovorax paradoxus]